VADELEGLDLERADAEDAFAARLLTRKQAIARLGLAGAGLMLGSTLTEDALAAVGLRHVVFRTANDGIGIGPPLAPFTVNESLLRWSKAQALEGNLAESWSHPSPTRYVVKLRPNVRFSDGSPLTPADVVYSFLRNYDPRFVDVSLGLVYKGKFKSIEHSGPREVTFHLEHPDFTFPFSYFTLTRIYKKSFTKPLGLNYGSSPHKMLGTGPYVVKSASPSAVVQRRNPHYWGKRPVVEELVSDHITDPNAQFAALQSGSIDAVFGVTGTDAVRYRSLPNVRLHGALSVQSFLAMNVTQSPVNNVHVRRAIAHAWNGPSFCRGPLQGTGVPSNGVVWPWQWNDVITRAERRAFFKELPTYPFSLDRAKAELRKSSTPNGFSTTVVTCTDFPGMTDAMTALAANLQKIGIHLNVKAVGIDLWVNAITSKTYPLTHVYFSVPNYGDPNDSPSILVGKTQSLNCANYNSPTVERLLAIEQSATNKHVRAKALEKLYKRMARDLPYLGLWWGRTYVAVRKPFDLPEPIFGGTPWYRYVTKAK
jgi:peptide/nickel transport system substrate-binding protein